MLGLQSVREFPPVKNGIIWRTNLSIWNTNLWTAFCMTGDISGGYSQANYNYNFNFNVNVTVDSSMNSSFNFSFSNLLKNFLGL